MKHLNHSASHTFGKETACVSTVLHLDRHNSSWSCCQTVLPQPKRQLSLECFVPRWIKHVPGHWNINVCWVKQGYSSSIWVLSFWSSSVSDYHVGLSDVSQLWNVINVTFSLWGFGSRNQRKSAFLLGMWPVGVLSWKWAYVMASFELLRWTMICIAATFFRDWGCLGARDGCYNSTDVLEKEEIKAVCLLMSKFQMLVQSNRKYIQHS